MNHRTIHVRAQARPHPAYPAFIALSALLLLAYAFLSPAYAGDDGVYGPAAPPDSAFIRVYNLTAEPIPEARIADKAFNDVAPFGASEFAFLPAGAYTLNVNGANQQVTLEKGRYYTAAVGTGGLKLIDTGRFDNRLKSLVIVYNLTDSPQISLKTADGKSVIDAVAANSSGTREVNAVRVSLGIYDGDKKVADARPVSLQRGKAFSLFVSGSREQPMSVWVVN